MFTWFQEGYAAVSLSVLLTANFYWRELAKSEGTWVPRGSPNGAVEIEARRVLDDAGHLDRRSRRERGKAFGGGPGFGTPGNRRQGPLRIEGTL